MAKGRLKTTAEHMRDGTLKPSYHANRLDKNGVPGKPTRPRGLNSAGRWLWDQVTTGLPPGTLGQLDTAALKSACELWQIWTRHKQSSERPEFYQGLAAFKEAKTILQRFGWTPGDRAKIQTPPPPKDDEDEQFFKVTA